MERVGPQPGALQPLPQRVLRRPAPAHRDRAGDRPEAEVHRLRRAGLGARRVDPGPDPEPAAGPPGGVRDRATCSWPTTSRWCGRSRTGSRSCTSATSWRARRGRSSTRRRCTRTPTRSCRRCRSRTRSASAAAAGSCSQGDLPEPDRPAQRLRLPDALLPGPGALRDRGAAAASSWRRATSWPATSRSRRRTCPKRIDLSAQGIEDTEAASAPPTRTSSRPTPATTRGSRPRGCSAGSSAGPRQRQPVGSWYSQPGCQSNSAVANSAEVAAEQQVVERPPVRGVGDQQDPRAIPLPRNVVAAAPTCERRRRDSSRRPATGRRCG